MSETRTVTIRTEAVIEKLICKECDHKIDVGEFIEVVEDYAGDTEWMICKECRSADSFRLVCDEPGCWELVSGGTPTPDGYRQTCYRHCPNRKKEAK